MYNIHMRNNPHPHHHDNFTSFLKKRSDLQRPLIALTMHNGLLSEGIEMRGEGCKKYTERPW